MPLNYDGEYTMNEKVKGNISGFYSMITDGYCFEEAGKLPDGYWSDEAELVAEVKDPVLKPQNTGRGGAHSKLKSNAKAGGQVDPLVMPFFITADKLPKDGEYVLVHLLKTNWIDKDDKHGGRYWKVAKFVKGISKEEREQMKKGELPDPTESLWNNSNGYSDVKRSDLYKSSDVQCNNLVPYSWDCFGPDSYFGQEVDIWARLPKMMEA